MSNDADAGASATGKSPGPMPDHCAYCGEILPGVHDRMWEVMDSCDGILVAANYCRNGKCEHRAQREASDVIAYVRHRRATEEPWEGDKPSEAA